MIDSFQAEGIDFALIGGLALQAEGLARTTLDIDLLILSQEAEKIKAIMQRGGYELRHESSDVLNFCSKNRDLGRVDFLLAHRKYATAMLKRAKLKEVQAGFFKVRVLAAEDIIGLKVQSSSNDPTRMLQDMADIEQLIKKNYSHLNRELLKEYFRLFEREKELEQIIMKIKNEA